MIRITQVMACLALLVISVAGCGKTERPAGMPDLYPCTLHFTQDGQPLAGATIAVVKAEGGSEQWSAGGITDDSGTVKLVTYGKYVGVAVGKHKVTVNKRESTAPAGKMDAGVNVSGPSGGGSLAQMKTFTLVEKKYTAKETTPLELEITPDSKTDKTFECGKAVKEQL